MSKLKLESKKSTNLNIRQRRIFSEEFKREKIQELNAGLYNISSCGSPSVCKLWNITAKSVYRWIYLYFPEHKKGITMIEQKESESQRASDLLKQFANQIFTLP